MHYLDSLTFITAKQGWFLNLVLCGVCLLIPVIGPIVVLGYSFEVFDSLHRDPDKRRYPNFEFDRFTKYLMRGLWPFLVQLIMNFVLALPIGIFTGITLAVTVAARNNGAIVALIWVVYALLILAI